MTTGTIRLLLAGTTVAALGGWFSITRDSHAPAPEVTKITRSTPRVIRSNGDLTTVLAGNDVDRLIETIGKALPSDPAGIAALVADRASPSLRVDALRTVAREWATIDPDAAIDWASSLPNETDRHDTLEFVCYRVAEDDPVRARELASGSGFAHDAPVVSDLVQQWAVRDPAAARTWVLGSPPGETRESMLAAIAPLLATDDPAAAGLIVSEELAGPRQEEAALSVLHQWALKDSTAAASWVSQFPEGPLKQRAEEELRGILAMVGKKD